MVLNNIFDSHPGLPLLRDVNSTIQQCDVIMFVGDKYLRYDGNLGHTAVVYESL